MRDARVTAVWNAPDVRLSIAEPTLDEVLAASRTLASFYNEPVNRALMTNEHEMTPNDVSAQYESMWESGGRPFLMSLDGELVGDCDFRCIAEGDAEFAILVGPRSTQAKGIGTRFGIMALVVAFGPLALRRVYASIRPENAGSLRMFEKVGYTVDSTASARRFAEEADDVCMSIDAARFDAAQRDAIQQIRVSTAVP